MLEDCKGSLHDNYSIHYFRNRMGNRREFSVGARRLAGAGDHVFLKYMCKTSAFMCTVY